MENLLPALPDEPLVPLWLKLGYTAFVLVLVPVYWKKWGPANFLWFSDVALLMMVPALWLESGLLASMMGISILIPETAWNIGFFGRLLTGIRLFSLTDYMWDTTKPLYLRALSLFHVIIPPLILWMIWRCGFYENAVYYQFALGWSILFLTYIFSDPAENINWVFGPGNQPQTTLDKRLYFAMVLLAFPLLFYLPTYFLLRLIF